MMVTAMEPVGIGDWQLAIEQLKSKLEAEGLLAPERKRPIPLMPKKIGVVTSQVGAAIQDILSALSRRNRSVNVLIAPCRVQGEGSAEEIVQAIQSLEQFPDIEVILVARGGGSIEDLWSFNTEIVVRAVAACRVPVICGVGHETDVTICDLVADMRAPTPTAAAELVARGKDELIDRWSALHNRLHKTTQEKIFAFRHRLLRASPARFLDNYQHRLQNNRLQILNLQDRLITAMDRLLSFSRHKLEQNSEKLKNLGLLNVLNRGFALVRKANGQLVQDSTQCAAGEILEILLARGKLIVTVESAAADWTIMPGSDDQKSVYKNIGYKDSVYKK